MRPALLLATLALAGCNLFGGDDTEAVAARREADGKAIGGACRHAGRAIEDCYTLNRRADRSAMYAGWREMNDYMRENKIDPVAPQLSAETAVAHAADGGAEGKKAGKAAEKTPEKSGDKAAAKAAGKADSAKSGEKSADKAAEKAADKSSDKPAGDKPAEKAPAKDAHSAAEANGPAES
ncbi:MAG: hypothetical protein U1E89_12035 [Burkholderiaceae bacterium]